MHSSINSQIIDGSTPNYDQLNHIFHGFLDSGRWLPKPIATAWEPLICQNILDLFAWPWTVSLMVLIRNLNFKISNRALLNKIGLAEGGTVLFETQSTDTVGVRRDYCVWFDLTGHRTPAIGLALTCEKKTLQFSHLISKPAMRVSAIHLQWQNF